ncbi:hypothetical protein F4782DRAFT_525129 [Xylaria castorea]|nr:hypothetical protein F4782DRAFT_525129 [Xylaria castorea]
MDLASALQTYREAMAANQNGMVEAFIDKLITLPPNPVRRRDPRYLPPNKTPSDPRLTLMPLWRKMKARSQSSPKRSAFGSTSLRKGGIVNHIAYALVFIKVRLKSFSITDQPLFLLVKLT